MDKTLERSGNVIRLHEVKAARDKDKAEARVLLLVGELRDRLVTLGAELDELKQHLQETATKNPT